MSLYSSAHSPISDLELSKLLEKKLPLFPWHRRILSWLTLRCKHIVHYWWAWEIFAGGISIVATAALIIILMNADQHVQQYTQLGGEELSLNTIVALITTVIRTSLVVTMAGALNQSTWNWFSCRRVGLPHSGKPLSDLDTFGDASSSSWSSLKLIWRTRGRNLAALGAIVIILSLGFDAFAQQVLATQTRSVVDFGGHSKTMIPRALSYMDRTNKHQTTISPDARRAIYSSVVSKNVSLPDSTCPTGNCSWPITPTVGLCSSCADARNRLHKDISDRNIEYSLDWTHSFFDPAYSDKVNIAYYMKEGEVAPGIELDVYAYGSGVTFNMTANGQLPLAQCFFVGIPPKSMDQLYNASNRTLPVNSFDSLVAAYDCRFYFCLQAFDVQTRAGVTEQRRLKPWGKVKYIDSVGHKNDSYEFIDVPPELNVANASQYQVDKGSYFLLAQEFTALLQGDGYTDSIARSYWTSTIGSDLYNYAFWNATDSLGSMTALCQQIGDGFTTWIRTSSSLSAPEDALYASTVFIDKVFYRVRWQWLAYPLGLLLTGHVFLIATIWHTRHLRTRPWKGHRIPLLLADMDDLVKRLGKGGLDSRTGLEDRVGRIKVRLEYEDGDEIVFRRVV